MATTTTPRPATPEDLELLRGRFPALQDSDEVLLDNAGGSQVPLEVIEEVGRYMREDYVQLGADYTRSRRATAIVERAHGVARALVNAGDRGEVILGMSTSSLCATLADAHRRSARGAEERPTVIVAEGGHEANIGPWVRLAEEGWEVRMWAAREDGSTHLEDLEALLDGSVRLVAMHHVSNLLGTVEDVAGAARLAHEHGARIVADGVAFAPHRAVDVQALGVDWYVFSTYKVYGPHLAVLYGSHEALAELEGPNHYFVPGDEVPYKWELGGVPHEGAAALVGTGRYLARVAGVQPEEELSRQTVEAAFGRMAELELPLQERLLSWLTERDDLRIIGLPGSGLERVPTVSFVHDTLDSGDIARAANTEGLCIRYGHFYAHRLAERLGLDPADGVVRTSMVHYNTPGEIEQLLAALGRILDGAAAS